MIELSLATENEMILAFLRAEIDSTREFDKRILQSLKSQGCTRALIDKPNLSDQTENEFRMKLLNYRGYYDRTFLFKGFPKDVEWRKVTLEEKDFGKIKYIKDDSEWENLSSRTRLVSEGARCLGSMRLQQPTHDDELFNKMEHIFSIVSDVQNGRRYPELILAEGDSGQLILIEGHSRATAYIIANCTKEIDAFVGTHPEMSNWAWY